MSREEVVFSLQDAKDAQLAAQALVALLEQHLLRMKEGAAPPSAAPR